LAEFPNLVIVQTLSKAWGMAGLRLGLGFAAKEIIAILNKIKPPYNVNEASIQAALIGLAHPDAMQKKVTDLIQQRKRLEKELASLKIVVKVYPSETNFLLVRFTDSFSVFRYLLSKSIVVRDRTHTKGCENTLRITVGTEEENTKLLQALQAYTV
jgi:histidinol-phosphate aminotransferase